MKATLVALLLAAVVAASQAKEGRKFLVGYASVSQCPTVTTKEDFDPLQILGAWYEIERFAVTFQEGMDCVQTTYSDLGEGLLEVHNAVRFAEAEFAESIGTVTVERGVMRVEFDGYFPGKYHVLDTDYTTFSTVYKCVQVEEVSFQYAWLLSRTPTCDQETYDRARQVFANNGIDVSLFQSTYQGDKCTYQSSSHTCSKKSSSDDESCQI